MVYEIGTRVFGDWEIVGEIGQGAYGRVYEIRKPTYQITTRAALKVVKVPSSQNEVEIALSERMDPQSAAQYFRGFVDEILNEIAVMAQFQSHPNIVSYQDHHVEEMSEGIGWDIQLKMELLESFVKYQKEHFRIEEDVIIDLGCDIANALIVCHKNGIVHRDIKPGNVFWDPVSGTFKLGDFGVSRTLEKTIGGLSRKGTENYMAPEVFNGKAYGKTIDIYSLGILLYCCANWNRLPFYPITGNMVSFEERENALFRRMSGEPLPAPCNASPELARIILKACAYDPQERYPSAEEFKAALEALKRQSLVSDKKADKDQSGETISFDDDQGEETISFDEDQGEETVRYHDSEKVTVSDTGKEEEASGDDEQDHDDTGKKQEEVKIPPTKKTRGFGIITLFVIPVLLTVAINIVVLNYSETDLPKISFPFKGIIFPTKEMTSPVLKTGSQVNEILHELSRDHLQESEFSERIQAIKRTNDSASLFVNAVDLSENETPVLAWFESETGTIYISSESDKIYLNSDSSRLFQGMKELKTLDLSGFDTSSVTNMKEMFTQCFALTEVDLSGFDTSSVTNMRGMFSSCTALTELDLSGFDTSSVIDMSEMFFDCFRLKELDLNGFDTSSVIDMSRMFSYCDNLSYLWTTNQDLFEEYNKR